MSGDILNKMFPSIFAEEEEEEDTRPFYVLYETIPKGHTCASLAERLKHELMRDEKAEWAKNIAENYNTGRGSTLLSMMIDAARELGLNIRKIEATPSSRDMTGSSCS